MAIVEHPHVTINDGVANVPGLVVQCDYCGVLAPKCGVDAGEAADKARKHGFATRKGASSTDPRKWACKRCNEKVILRPISQ